MKTFRILEDGDQYWQGRAYDADHALERCYDDGGPGSLVKVTIEKWGKVKLSRALRAPGWVKVWEGQYCVN